MCYGRQVLMADNWVGRGMVSWACHYGRLELGRHYAWHGWLKVETHALDHLGLEVKVLRAGGLER